MFESLALRDRLEAGAFLVTCSGLTSSRKFDTFEKFAQKRRWRL
jgi:hypothetical protein